MSIRAGNNKAIGALGVVLAVAAALALGSGATAPAIAKAPSGTAARTLPRVLCWTGFARARAKRRPKRCSFVSSKPSSKRPVRLVKLRWKRWKAGRATGTFAGHARFRVTLRRRVHGCHGPVFSRAVVRRRHATKRLKLRTRCVVHRSPGTQPGGGAPPPPTPPTSESCVTGGEARAAGQDAPPSISPALFGRSFVLDASLDGIAEDGTLPLDIGGVCGLPASLAPDAQALVGLSGVALLSAGTEVWSCEGSAEEAGTDTATGCTDIPAKGGTRLTGAAATTALDGADTAFVGVQLLPQSVWHADEDGSPLPTFAASWVKTTD